MRVVGNSLTARFLVLALAKAGVAAEWYAPAATEEWLPTLAMLPAPTISLAYHSRSLWQQWEALLPQPLLGQVAFADLASTPGRATKLAEEALLDALSGDAVSYQPTPPLGLHPRLVMGARLQPAAPYLLPAAENILEVALQNEGLSPQPLPPEFSATWLAAEPTVLAQNELIAATHPHLKLQPRRRHTLSFTLVQPLVLPVSPALLLHRMPRGHLWVWLHPTHLQVVYDGAADPRQNTTSVRPDKPTVSALTQYLSNLFLALRHQPLAPPAATCVTDFITPDGLPLCGPASEGSPLWLLGGMGAQSALYAPALAEKLTELQQRAEHFQNILSPQRLLALNTEAPFVPESLQFTEAAAAPQVPELPAAPLRGETQLNAEPDIKRATEVRMVGKTVTSGADATWRDGGSKPKVQTSAVKA